MVHNSVPSSGAKTDLSKNLLSFGSATLLKAMKAGVLFVSMPSGAFNVICVQYAGAWEYSCEARLAVDIL